MDASIACKLIKPEADSAAVRLFVAGLHENTRLVAPGHLRYEVGNACLRNHAVVDLEAHLTHLAAVVDTINPRDVARFTEGLSYYDAAYLALAIEQKAGLLTADDKMRKAAVKHGVPVGP